jgi:DNA-binding NarL/FixJ family response regulator
MTAPTPPRASLLLVDDSKLVRSYLRQLLSATPGVHIVGEAGSVPEAIERFEALAPEVVVLDIQMPGGSGMDVLEWIKQRSPSCVVIMASSCPPQVYGPLCREAGADWYLDKLSEMDTIAEVLQTALGTAASASAHPKPEAPRLVPYAPVAADAEPSTRPACANQGGGKEAGNPCG